MWTKAFFHSFQKETELTWKFFIKIEVDKLGIDFILSSTQKAWGLPAGFSICSVSDKIINKSKSINNKGYFLDIEVYEKCI